MVQQIPLAQKEEDFPRRRVVDPHDPHPLFAVGLFTRPVEQLQIGVAVERRREMVADGPVRIRREAQPEVERDIGHRGEVFRPGFVPEQFLQLQKQPLRIFLILIRKQQIGQQIGGVLGQAASGGDAAVTEPVPAADAGDGDFVAAAGRKQQYGRGDQQEVSGGGFHCPASFAG